MTKLKCLNCSTIHRQFIPSHEYKKICNDPEKRINTFCFKCKGFTNHIINYDPE